jgi:2-(1,2-epoxy-1,2-dihydrophenyl)acetyl-CoA isomerase
MSSKTIQSTPGAVPSAVITELVPGGVILITLNRPSKRNALDEQSWKGIYDAFARAREPSVRAIVISGTGTTFCAGADLNSIKKSGKSVYSSAARLSMAHEVLLAIFESPKPTMAAVEGGAVGIGWALALACDIVIASSTAFFSSPYLSRGLVPDGGIGWFLQQSVGWHRAMDVLLSPNRITAAQASGLGLVSRMAPDGQAQSSALTLARELAAGPTDTIELLKGLMRRNAAQSLRSYLANEKDSYVLNSFTPNPDEGVQAFLEKRAPSFARIG